MTEEIKPLPNASLKELEAAAMVRIAGMVKDSPTKPSLEAARIAAQLLARKAYKTQSRAGAPSHKAPE
ncbi:MAG: hypothetical protein WBK09_03305 [Limnohabitans sp.]|uniref:hypothetical protein n=1 Tax=Limnohabitans sp. TaxID=1907725 RepID=UPI003BAEB5DB